MALTSSSPPLIERPVSLVRLHGEACWICGDGVRRLHPAGVVRTRVEGGEREWPVVACGSHLREPIQ